MILGLAHWPSSSCTHLPHPPCSNGTYLEAAVGATTDGLMATSALPDYPESFAVSAAQDPGA